MKNKKLSITERIDAFIAFEGGGHERDAVAVALAKLEAARREIKALKAQVKEMAQQDCND